MDPTSTLAPADPYTTDFEATVERRDGRDLVLDRTYFYAESGGQPADRGIISDVPVVDVQHRNGEVVHTLAEERDISGETVPCVVDSAFRTYCMRAHTASHVLYGAGRRLLDDLGYGGFGIDEEKIRIDFETTTDIDDDTLAELERLANRAVWESRPVSWESVPVETAREREDVAFNTKTEEGVFEESEGVRIVTVGGTEGERSSADPAGESWDMAACGGTHVSNTSEIGPITVLERSNPGEGLTRVELAVGPAAIDRRAETRRVADEAARALGVSVSDLPEEAQRQREEINRLESERDELLDQVATAQLDAIRDDAVERDGERWLVGTLVGVDADTLTDQARDLASEEADVVALVADETPATVTVAAAGETDAGALIGNVTEEFGGGGGGGSEFAQGGGIAEDPETVVRYLRGE